MDEEILSWNLYLGLEIFSSTDLQMDLTLEYILRK